MKDMPAFPLNELDQITGQIHAQHFGMTLRDYFAAGAMQTLLGSEYTSEHGLHEGWMRAMAHEAYMVADAMITVADALKKARQEQFREADEERRRKAQEADAMLRARLE